MVFLTIIGSFIGKIFSKEYLPFTLIVLIFGLIFFNLSTCNSLKIERTARERDKQIYDQNFDALFDTITKTYNQSLKADEYTKGIFLTTLDELIKYDSSLFDELNKVKGEILGAIESNADINIPEASVDNEIEDFGDSKYGLRWNYTYTDPGLSQFLSGSSRFSLINNKIYPGKTIIDTNRMSLSITYGFKELDEKYKVWAISKSPVVRISELSGAYFIDKPAPFEAEKSYKKPWVIGPYIGYGVNFNDKFQESRLGWNFGISLQYNLLNFGRSAPKMERKKKIPIIDDIIGINYDTIFMHNVKKDQTLYSISLAYNTNVNNIKLFNKLNNDNIYENQKLLIPVKK